METIENAIHSELITASGLAGDRIIYEHQNRDALGKSGSSREFMTILVQDPKSLAPATPRRTVRDNPTPSAGAEILIGVATDFEFIVRVTFYAGPVSGAGSAYDRLTTLIDKLALDEVSLRLAAASVVFVESGGVRSVPTVLETEYESRAVADLRFRARRSTETPETYIETAEWSATYT